MNKLDHTAAPAQADLSSIRGVTQLLTETTAQNGFWTQKLTEYVHLPERTLDDLKTLVIALAVHLDKQIAAIFELEEDIGDLNNIIDQKDDELAQAVAVPDGYALVPVEPTPEMVAAAAEAHMPFGDMHLAIMLGNLAAQKGGAA